MLYSLPFAIFKSRLTLTSSQNADKSGKYARSEWKSETSNGIGDCTLKWGAMREIRWLRCTAKVTVMGICTNSFHF